MALTSKTILEKTVPTTDNRLTKVWSIKNRLRSFRRSLTAARGVGSEKNVERTHLSSDYSPIRADVWRALSPAELPMFAIYPVLSVHSISNDVFAASTGPNSGMLAVRKWETKLKPPISDTLSSWRMARSRKAHGLSVSLYEKNPLLNRVTGEPIADCFVICARRDSAFLAVADGLNWGRDAMKAARCAIYTVYEHLEMNLYGSNSTVTLNTTKDAAQLLFETLSLAQERIVSCTIGLTTLCVALILPVSDDPTGSSYSSSSSTHSPTYSLPEDYDHVRRFSLIVVSVGDSQAFLISKSHGIRQVTGYVTNSSEDQCVSGTYATNLAPVRNFRDTGGALGSVYKDGSPELKNLMCAVTLCDPGDIVLLGTDGLTDNFDPVITQLAIPESPYLEFMDEPPLNLDDTSSVLSICRSESSLGYSLLPANVQSNPIRSRFEPFSPPSVSIWPAPPPPPTQTPPSFDLLPCTPTSRINTSDHDQQSSAISARNLNFSDRLELNWFERQRYAEKEIERIWHEVDAAVSNCSSDIGTASSRDLCDALISQVVQVTADKRKILEDPEYASLRMSSNKLKHFNLPLPEDTVGNISTEIKRRWLTETLNQTSGKLDHATVAAYEVGYYNDDENEVYEQQL